MAQLCLKGRVVNSKVSTKTGVLELSRDSGSSQAWAAGEGVPWEVLCEQISVLIRGQS